MTEPIKPATDEEVRGFISEITNDDWYCDCDTQDGETHKTGCNAMRPDTILARIESDAAKLKALELERDTVQQYADQVGANLRAAEATLAEQDEQIARMRELLKAAKGHCDCTDYNGRGLFPCTDHNKCAGCAMVNAIDCEIRKEGRGESVA